MNEHSKRILLRINNDLASFIQGNIDEKTLIKHVEAHTGGIEDSVVRNDLEFFVATVEELFYTSDKETIKKFVASFSNKLTQAIAQN